MNDFHYTVIGRKFYEQQLPALTKALNRLAEATEKANDTNVCKAQTFQSEPQEEEYIGYICPSIYTPQTFLEVLTGTCYCIDGDDDTETIHSILRANGIENDTTDTLWDYSLADTRHIVEENIDAVLVEVCHFDENDRLVKEYRWFEIPDTFVEKFKNMENSL